MELRYAINTRHSLRRKMPVLTETVMECNFGVAPVDSENTCTSFKLRNDGLIATKWCVGSYNFFFLGGGDMCVVVVRFSLW